MRMNIGKIRDGKKFVVQTPCKKDYYPRKTTQGGKGGSPKA